jgi:F0F1-type ATP synthase alpha subunit
LVDCLVDCLGIELVELKGVLLVGRWDYMKVGVSVEPSENKLELELDRKMVGRMVDCWVDLLVG